jgi:hypothetical protein
MANLEATLTRHNGTRWLQLFPYSLVLMQRRTLPGSLMNVDDQLRGLCDRASLSRDPAEVTEILSQLRAILHQHIAGIRKLVNERRRRSELQQELSDIAHVF